MQPDDDDAADTAAADATMADIASGKSEAIPSEIVDKLIDEPDRHMRIWREYRGLSQAKLAREAGISRTYLREIEAGKKSGSKSVRERIAAVLRLDVDDIA